MEPKALILTGYGINCDDETKFAFNKAGAIAEKVHINDLIANKGRLDDYQIFAFPGGFSYGDDTGAGLAMANKIRNHLIDDVKRFVEKDKLVLGICNGFQILVNLGLVPALDRKYGQTQAALTNNDCARYHARWVDLEFSGNSPWTQDMLRASFPIAHGEGKFYATDKILRSMKQKNLIEAKYISGEICEYQNLPANPNGSLEDIAGITDETGRVLGMMPHPERAISFTQLPNWTFLKEKLRRQGKEMPEEYDGMKIFRNGVSYFK